MGILNVTPDSFSDGGLHLSLEAALSHAHHMIEQGADIIDVGGESTRPGAQRVCAEQQLQRVIPVIKQLKQEIPAHIPISIDTTSHSVAEAALNSGARMVNDVSAGRDDALFKLVAERRVPYVLMHMQGVPQTMQDDPQYDDVVDEITSFLLDRAQAAQAAGVKKESIIIDPGIGFGKSRQDNLDIIAHLQDLTDTGYPVLLGASRKRFMGAICPIENHSELVGATCATTAFGVLSGVKLFRVHDIKENRQALDVAWAIKNSI